MSEPAVPPSSESPSPSPEAEQTLREGSPSQFTNITTYLLCALVVGGLAAGAFFVSPQSPQVAMALAGATVLPILFALIRWVRTRCQRYVLTSERLLISTGVLSRHTEEVELYRVKDYSLVEPLAYRIFGLGSIRITTTDDSNAEILIRAIPRAASFRDLLRTHVELRRSAKHVRINEFE